MTIDLVNFEMTLEVLGDGEDACEFFKCYQAETKKEIIMMRGYLNNHDWIEIKRICHTWKGRNSQIGFRKSSLLAASLHDFLQQAPLSSDEEGSFEDELSVVGGQVELFLRAMEVEGGVIEEFLKSQYLL